MSEDVIHASSPERRRLLKLAGASLVLLVTPFSQAAGAAAKAPSVLAVRVWPANDYTRVTIETDIPVKFTQFLVKSPERLVVDMEGIELNSVLQSLSNKVAADDPYIRLLRAGRFSPGVVRLVMDLKTEVAPQVFTLKPVAEYGNRLVVDVYPLTPPDPFLALLDKDGEPLPKELKDGAAGANVNTNTNAASTTQIASASGTSGTNTPAAGGTGSETPKTPKVADGPGTSTGDTPATPAGNAANARPDSVQIAKAGDSVLSLPDEAGKETGKSSTGGSKTQKGKPVVSRLVTIMIDPGHGGEDPGAVGNRGTHEKTVTLAIAKRLKSKIDAEPNMRAALTRDADFFVPLPTRVEKARRINSDLFLSIHADAFVKPDARGSSVFVLSERGASSSAARWLAQKENEADLIGGVNIAVKDRFLARTLLDLSQTATNNDSMKLGKTVLGHLGDINRLHKGQVEQAGFAVLKAPDIPSILIETAFISNPEEEVRLKDEAYQDKMAEAILRGIRQYFAKNPPLAKSRLAKLDD